MDFFGIKRGSIRSEALNKLAVFSLQHPEEAAVTKSSTNGHTNGYLNGDSKKNKLVTQDFTKLANAVSVSDISSVPITHKELEIVLALTNSSHAVSNMDQAVALLEVLEPYLIESPFQQFKSHSSLQLSPSPWETVTRSLTKSIVDLRERFTQLSEQIDSVLDRYLSAFESRDKLKLCSYFSLIGFIRALTDSDSSLNSSLVEKLVKLINTQFLTSVEKIGSESLEDEHDYNYLLAYQATGDEFSSLLFVKLVQQLSARVLKTIATERFPKSNGPLIEFLLERTAEDYDADVDTSTPLDTVKTSLSYKLPIVEVLAKSSLLQIEDLDNGSSYINMTSYERIKLALHTKSLAYEVIGAGLLVNIVSPETALNLVKNSLSHAHEIADENLAPAIISLGSLLCYKEDKSISGQLVHSFPLIISNSSAGNNDGAFVERISKNLALGLKPLDQDSIVTTIYSLVNLLAVDKEGAPVSAIRDLRLRSARNTINSLDANFVVRPSRANTLHSLRANGSTASVDLASGTSSDKTVFKNAIKSVIEIAKSYDDPSIVVLTVTVLSQKFQKVSKELDLQLLYGLAGIAPSLSKKEFLILTKMFDSGIANATQRNDHSLVSAIINARISISKQLHKDTEHPLYDVYLYELLNNVVSRGDIQTADHHRSHGEISEVAKQIAYFFKPLAALLPKKKALDLNDNVDLINAFRNFWFNLVVHGYSETSKFTVDNQRELEIIALSTPPLASELPRLHTETSFELNAVLRRGSSNHNVKDQKHIIGGVSNSNSLEVRALSYPKLMFLSATSLLENLRVMTGDCSTVLYYFSDPSIVKTNIEKFIGSIVISIISKFVKLTGKGGDQHFTSDIVAEQLTKVLILTCHRSYDLQDAAFQSANLLIHKLPSSLCHHQSLYTLLDILTLLFDSIVDSDTNRYEPQRQFYLKHSKVKLTLSDSYKWRRSTLEKLHKRAKEWCLLSLAKSNQDMKSLLQAYITDLGVFKRLNSVEFGVSFAVEVAGTILPTDLELSNIPSTALEKPDTIAGFLSQYSWRSRNIAEKASIVPIRDLRNNKNDEFKGLRQKIVLGEPVSEQELLNVMDLIASLLILRQGDEDTARLVYELVSIPFEVFTSDSMKVATTVWLSIIKERQDLSFLLLSEIAVFWEDSIKKRKGLYSKTYDLLDEGFLKMTYSPSDKQRVSYQSHLVSNSLQTHLHVIKLFSSHFQGTLYQSEHLLKVFTRIVSVGLEHLKIASLHPFARLIRNELIDLGFDVLHVHSKHQSTSVLPLTSVILEGILSWFVKKNHYPYGSNNLKVKADLNLLISIFEQVKAISSTYSEKISLLKHLSLIFLRDEVSKIMVWLTPTHPMEFKADSYKPDAKILQFAYRESPILGIALADRFPSLEKSLLELIAIEPTKVLPYHEGVPFLLKIPRASKYLILAQPISPTDSINLFQPPFFEDPSVIQFNMRSLESHDVNLTFFYVPQIVQSLRNDSLGYVGRFIVETGKTDQLFAHQIIWNMLANSYKDEDSTIEDSIKPKLDYIMEKMISAFPEEDLIFYKTEFKFFNEVTDISGKLKPYIKKTKAEKKVKIDEEMAKIEVVDNVYLPSNPDGVVIDINRSSGKPLQSHAKAPFMATFKIKKSEDYNGELITYEKWQSAIFKVGDDCRQDVLALQLISIFKSIWENSGLDLYCFPYRVTATAPGCGVIDVLPNSISRDMLGREAVNGLYEYFISKFGNENSVEFEEARNNFVKSLAAYSIISYLLQFKDRHNGNIMYDDKGHILHIDFGFCFDIVPGGVKFEAVPFKLTKEMVKVMGGSNETESFKMFEELFIKGFLAVRPFYELIVGNVIPMLDSGLPCFKGEKTIRNLKNRFFLNKDDKETIGALKGLIRSSYESMFTVGYDRFQKMTNGIPY